MSILATIALKSGLPLIERLLSQKLGDANGALAGQVLGAIAARAGVPPEQIEALADSAPGRVIEAMREVERMSPELISLYAKELEAQVALMQSEQSGGAWQSAWRPAGMYLLAFLWLWNTVLLHIANAVFRIALPVLPFEQLIQLSGLYMGLYMGGHTVKDVVGKWVGK